MYSEIPFQIQKQVSSWITHSVCSQQLFHNRHTVSLFGNFWKIHGFRRGIKYTETIWRSYLRASRAGLWFLHVSFSSALQNCKHRGRWWDCQPFIPTCKNICLTPSAWSGYPLRRGHGSPGLPPSDKNIFSNKMGWSLERVRFTGNCSIIKDQFYPVWNSEKGKKLFLLFSYRPPAVGFESRI